MALTKYRLGAVLTPRYERCEIPDLTPWQVSGVNREKEFFEPSHQVGEDTSNYQVVPPRCFACNLMHVGRDRVLPVAYNHSGRVKYVSPAYTVFSLREDAGILDEYFFIMLKSEERDRYFWFHADASVRDGMSWRGFCDVEITVPGLPAQQKYVGIYRAMRANQESFERGLEDLRRSLDGFMDQIKGSAAKRPAGELLEEVDRRNGGGEITSVRGINIAKQFMPSVADTNGVNLKNYKVVRKGQFAYSGMQTGRDGCIRIALYQEEEPIIISPAYTVFQVRDPSVLPEYMMIWFSRGESDRRGWFMSDASIRSNLDLERFYETELPIPDMEAQRAAVNLYRAYITRRDIGEQLKAQIRSICPVLIRGSLEDGG